MLRLLKDGGSERGWWGRLYLVSVFLSTGNSLQKGLSQPVS